jgi:hypothetical protein
LPSELVIVDNFSTEEKLTEMSCLLSLAKVRLFGDRVKLKLAPIANGEFSHAYSTNVGVFLADGDLVCITNGHSLPKSNVWLGSGVAHFRASRVVGVGGYSAPHEDGTLWEKFAYGWMWKGFNERSKVYVKDRYFSTMNCILRKALWEEYPFDERLPDEIPSSKQFGGEDYDWAREMLAREYEVVVEPEFCVYHSHGESLPVLVSKYFAWRHIRKRIGELERPRKSHTRLKTMRPRCHCF